MTWNRLDVTGERYGRLIAVQRLPNGKRHRSVWLFRCDCGTEKALSLELVRGGGTTSCGCYRLERIKATNSKHGHCTKRTSRTMRSYLNAKQRCFNPKNEKFPQYGGRGIIMCQEWASDFRAFLRDVGECPPGFTIERINVDGNYEPGNVRWATSKEQARNRTDNIFVEHEGQRMVLQDFANLMGVSEEALRRRVKNRHQDPHEAVQKMLKNQRLNLGASGSGILGGTTEG